MEKDIYKIKENELTYGRGYVYSLQYHIVWCTKYRRPVLKDGVDTDCKSLLQELAREYRFQIMAMEVMPDHIHLLITYSPDISLTSIVRRLKQKSVHVLWNKHVYS